MLVAIEAEQGVEEKRFPESHRLGDESPQEGRRHRGRLVRRVHEADGAGAVFLANHAGGEREYEALGRIEARAQKREQAQGDESSIRRVTKTRGRGRSSPSL